MRETLGLLHQQHLAGALDGPAQAALVMRRKSGILAGQQTPLIRDKSPQQVGILEIQGVNGELDLGLRPWGAWLGRRAAAAIAVSLFLGISFARHKLLLDFLMHSVPAQEGIILLLLDFLGLRLFIARGHIT